MPDPSLRSSRLTIAAGLLVVLALAGGGFYIGRTTSKAVAPVVVEVPRAAIRLPPSPGDAPRALVRGDLVHVGARAADAFSSGAATPRAVLDAAGRRFDLALPFGCNGPAEATSRAPMRWSYDTKRQTLRITAAPTSWAATSWNLGAGISDGQEQRLEGFFVERPWDSSPDCPPAPHAATLAGNLPLTLAPETLAVAEVVPETRKGTRRPYEVVKRVAADKVGGDAGFRLRLRGRIERLVGDSPVSCVQPAGPFQHPLCLIGMAIDEVRIENPTTGDVLGTWTTQAATAGAGGNPS